MPRKANSACRVSAWLDATQRLSDAKGKLRDALKENSLTADERALFALLQDGVAVQSNERPATNLGRPTKETSPSMTRPKESEV